MVKAYLQDKLLWILTYVIGVTSIICFFYLLNDSKVELLYPIVLALLFLIIALIIDGCRYYTVYQNLIKKTVLNSPNHEQRLWLDWIKTIRQQADQRYFTTQMHYQTQYYFLSQWFHDLKAPIATMKLLINENVVLQQVNQQLDDMVNQAMIMIRFDRMTNDLTMTDCIVNEVVYEIVQEKQLDCDQRNITLHLDMPTQDIHFITDVKWFTIIIKQLLSNAIKYTEAKHTTQIRQHIFCLIKQTKTTIEVQIKDEGIGISEHDLPRVFEPFFTGENGRVVESASGIGLYLCHKIAQTLQCELNITSIKNQGTTATLTIT